MTFGLYKVDGVVTAMSALSHNSDVTFGNMTRLRRQVYMHDDKRIQIPFVSGNAIRGVLRRHAMTDMLQRVGFKIDVDTPGGKRVYHALFTGGILEKTKMVGLDLETKKSIFETIPLARIFGWAWGNQMLESQMKVGHMIPICRETRRFVPIETDGPLPAIKSCMSVTYHTRRDDLKAERDKDEQAHQMLYTFEVFNPGVQFWHRFSLEDPEPVMQSALWHVIDLWNKYSYIGGKSGTGLGQLKLDYQTDPDITSAAYLGHLDEHSQDICDRLDKMAKDGPA